MIKQSKLAFPVLLMAILLAACGGVEKNSFQLTPQQTLEKAASLDYIITQAEFEKMRPESNDNLLLLDLRQPIEYDRGHLPNAVNIPTAHLLDDSSINLLEKSPSVVLYHESASGANGPWLLLTQLGFENVKILQSGYADTTESVTPEMARYDYAAIFQTAIERHQKEIEAGTQKATPAQPAAAVPSAKAPAKKTIVPEKKPEPKKVEEEEGC